MPVADPSDPQPTSDRHGSATSRGCLLAVVAIPIAIVLPYASLKLLGAAASDCRAYDAGDRFGLLFFYFPILWIAFVVPAFVIGRRSPWVGVCVGMAVVLVIAYAVAGSAADTIRQYGSPDTCPTFVPDWWPWFLPR
jgi:hypothetical protein